MDKLNRRQFAQGFGAALGGAAVLPALAKAALATPTEEAAASARAATAAEAARRQHAPKDIEGAIQIDSNENPYGPSQAARTAITGSEAVACRYPDLANRRMTDAIAAYHKVNSNQVLIGCGSTEILRTSDITFLSAGKNVIVATPTFESVMNYSKLMQANPVTVPMTADHRHDLPAMAAAINDQTGLVYICNPNNPTGTINTLAELKSFMPKVPAHVTVLVDEAYWHFVTDPAYGSVVDWIPQYPNLVVARTFSKVFGMAGMRLGYAIGSTATIARMRQNELGFNGNVAVLEAGLVSLTDADHVADQRQKNTSTRAWLYAELERDGRKYIPSHANFVMIDVGGDVTPTIGAFRDRKILVGRKFPAMPNFLRVSMGTPKEMQAFMGALREIVPAHKA